MEYWPLFHNGVAAGLRLSTTPESTDIDSTWRTHTRGKMRGTFLLMCLIGLTIAEDVPQLTEDETMMVNEMMDVIESGLGNPQDKRDRALFISLTLTSTSTDLMTATVTETVTASCYSPTLSECTTTTTTTTTTAASTGRKRRSPKFDMFMDLVGHVV